MAVSTSDLSEDVNAFIDHSDAGTAAAIRDPSAS